MHVIEANMIPTIKSKHMFYSPSLLYKCFCQPYGFVERSGKIITHFIDALQGNMCACRNFACTNTFREISFVGCKLKEVVHQAHIKP